MKFIFFFVTIVLVSTADYSLAQVFRAIPVIPLTVFGQYTGKSIKISHMQPQFATVGQ